MVGQEKDGVWLKREDYDSIYTFCAIFEHALDHMDREVAIRRIKAVFTDDVFDKVIPHILNYYDKGERITNPTEVLDSEIADLLGVETDERVS